eukprot:CAMPEP_0185578470 /NCGR_PEP_ID=MMETSP0434-20130131/12951_1 /TAXON_ID=626734 ORGANISM="Favella taraikaensis, Strain Fe Narragansett Bay" /NCGR_SAMPLE_ID=MMETSP0434 /ASSEMBLY_ACC=CAM_ASM_000379 /LENGTH=77 /DNA_ID=CAMNT_0028196283 /DNA_START=287 /DNA_END=520 /DNA_ORIENTATION=+
MANKLSNPAANVDEAHEPELVHAEVALLAMHHPACVAQEHAGPPPDGDRQSDFPVNEVVGCAHDDIGHETKANFVAE